MRLTRITTRTGDDGSTGLADGARLSKDDVRIVAIGNIDELNSQIGVLLAEDLPRDIGTVLLQIQNDLFDLGGVLAQPGRGTFQETRVAWLDGQVAHFNADLPPLREFILPGGSRAAALCHVARCIARRAERDVVALSRRNGGSPDGNVPQHALPYLNRLSDLLFVLSRCINRVCATQERLWQRSREDE